jgi:hypothetical protein
MGYYFFKMSFSIAQVGLELSILSMTPECGECLFVPMHSDSFGGFNVCLQVYFCKDELLDFLTS